MRILLKSGKERTLALESKSHVLLFRYIPKLKKCAIELVSKLNFNSNHYKSLSRHKPQGFLGLINMSNDIFLCVIISKVEAASPLKNEIIHKIIDVEFHCLTNNSWDFLELNSNGYPNVENDIENQSNGNYIPKIDQHPCWELRKLLNDGSFFYSKDFDLTSTLQGRGISSNRNLSMDRYHLDYMWNSFMMEEIINFTHNLNEKDKLTLDNDQFLTICIRGFAESLRINMSNRHAVLTIISKQSWKRAGTRFNVRGVDDDGNVANFVETELILNDNNHIFAFTQIRGSIPLFWEQDTALISPKVQITRSFNATEPAFEKHFQNLISKYGPINIINLLSNSKTSELELSRSFKKHFLSLQKELPDSIFFTDFDFHQETSKTYAQASKVLKYISESLSEFGYFCYDLKNNKVLMEQDGTFRTNCLDCLDRTNVIQQVISLAVLEEYLTNFQVKDSFDLKNKHSILWANHGDQISQIYTGTNALKSSFSRSGKMGFAGALSDATKSISRIYINNFVDKGKQQVTDTLLGKNSSQQQVYIFDPINDYLNNQLVKFESKFINYKDISIFAGTYNLAGVAESGNLSEWLFPKENFKPDIFIIGFQEVIELNASNILKNDGSAGNYWKHVVQQNLDKNCSDENYVLLRSEFMSSILLLLFVKSSHVSNVTQVEGKSKKTGLGGMTANKGSVAIRFNFGSSTFCFFNSHLAAGMTNTEERYNDFMSCWNGIRFSRNRLIQHHDYIIWLGDLNYRVSVPNEEARHLININKLNELLNFDQLSYEMKRRSELKQFKESTINFPPTYKFDKNSHNYDSSEKQRVPSWTDRILYRGKNLQPLIYSIAYNITFSDHRPVFSIFKAPIKIIDPELKEKISDELIKDFNSSSQDQSLIELNDPDDSLSHSSYPDKDLDDYLDENSSSSKNSSSISSSTLIDIPSSASSPPIPQRRGIPPPYDVLESQSMLIPGLTPTTINQSIDRSKVLSLQPTPSPPKLPQRSQPPMQSQQSSFGVMRPTVSRTGTPVSKVSSPVPAPPPPPPRKPSNSNPVPNQMTHDTAIKENHKLPPMIPIKPKSLNSMFTADTGKNTEVEKQLTSSTNIDSGWTAMTPTKKL